MIKPKKLEKVDFRDNYNYICYIILTKSHLIRKSNIHLETQASNVHFFPFFFFFLKDHAPFSLDVRAYKMK